MLNPPASKTAWPMFSMVVFTVLAAAVLMVLPLLVGAMMENLGFTAQQAGLLAASDMIGASVAALGISFFMTRGRWRLMLFWGIGILTVANVLSGLVDKFLPLALLRIAAGFGGGTLLAIANASIGETDNPDRGFGLSVVGQVAFGSVALYFIPWLLGAFGLTSIFFGLALMTFAGAFLVRNLPNQARVNAATSISAVGLSSKSIIGLAGLFSYFVTQGGVWTYLERIGSVNHISLQSIGMALAVSSVAGLVGGALASWLGVQMGRIKPLLFAAVCTLCSLIALSQSIQLTAFLALASLFNFAWNFSVPFQFGALSEIDPSRRTVVLGGAAAFAGLAVGPAIASLIIADGSYDNVIWMGMIFCVLSTIFLMRILLPLERKVAVIGG